MLQPQTGRMTRFELEDAGCFADCGLDPSQAPCKVLEQRIYMKWELRIVDNAVMFNCVRDKEDLKYFFPYIHPNCVEIIKNGAPQLQLCSQYPYMLKFVPTSGTE